MPLKIHTFLPGGYGDPCFTLWTLGWDFRHFAHCDFSTYWDGNIFYPSEGATRYSDPLIGVALTAYPIYLVTGELIMTVNLFFLLTSVLSAFFTFLLVYYLTKDYYAALVSGLIFSFNPFRSAQLGHIQILAMMWIPLLFLLLYLILDRRKIIYWPFFLLLFLLNALTSGYHGIFFSVFLGVFVVWLLVSRQVNGNFIAGLALCLVVSFMVLFPLYNSITMTKGESQWPIDFVRSQSPGLRSFIEADSHNICFGEVLRASGTLPFNKVLFPGFIPVLFMFLCIWCRHGIRDFKTRDFTFYLIMISGAVVLSLGPSMEIFGNTVTMPYSFFYDLVPGFKSLRYSNRMMECALLGMAVLAGFVLAHFNLKLSNRFRKTCVVLLSICIVAEGLSIPIKGASFPNEKSMPPVYRWLNTAPDGPVIEYPMSPDGQNSLSAEYMYYSTFHWKKLVNGASNRTPPEYSSLKSELQLFPRKQALDRLAGIGVRYIIVHTSRYDEASGIEMLNYLQNLEGDSLKKVYEDDRDLVYELTAQSGALR